MNTATAITVARLAPFWWGMGLLVLALIVLGPVMFATADSILQILREPQPTPAAEPATL